MERGYGWAAFQAQSLSAGSRGRSCHIHEGLMCRAHILQAIRLCCWDGCPGLQEQPAVEAERVLFLSSDTGFTYTQDVPTLTPPGGLSLCELGSEGRVPCMQLAAVAML